MRRSQITSILLLAFVFFACSHDDLVVPVDPPDPPDELGAFAVGYSTFSTIDPQRDDRIVPVDLWYPVDPTVAPDFPPAKYLLAAGIGLESQVAVAGAPVSDVEEHALLIFSHGYGGIALQSTDLMEALASHGFVVASLTHTGNTSDDQSDSFDEAATNRVPDVTLAIDAMFERNRDSDDGLYGSLDESLVGVIGHSFGGMTAVGVAAGWAGAAPDPRVTAIVAISAVIDCELQSDARSGPNCGFTAEQLAEITVPAMLIGGTEDVNVFIENNSIAFEQLVNAPRVYQVDVVGANHTHFAGVCVIGNFLIDLGIGPDIWPDIGAEALLEPYRATCGPDAFPFEEATRLTSLYSVAFFKRHLLGERGYDRYLTPGYSDSEPAIDFRSK